MSQQGYVMMSGCSLSPWNASRSWVRYPTLKKLSPDWVTEDWVDFEYKKYVFLDYMQSVRHYFGERKLYPMLSDLIWHHNNLRSLGRVRHFLESNLQRTLVDIDMDKGEVSYRSGLEGDRVMDEIRLIIDYALPRVEETLTEGKALHRQVESEVLLEPVGLRAPESREGYLLVDSPLRSRIGVYRYRATRVHVDSERYVGLHTDFVRWEKKRSYRSLELLKSKLSQALGDSIPAPAVFLSFNKGAYPLHETFLPISQRMLLKNFASNG